MRKGLAVAAVLNCMHASAGTIGSDLQFGVVWNEGSVACASGLGTALPGTTVWIISQDNTRVSRELVLGAAEGNECMRFSDTEKVYRLSAGPKNGELSVAIAGVLELRGKGQRVVAATEGKVYELRVLQCASKEGVHFTVWTGNGSEFSRIWHRYVYLGYDIEPNCQPDKL